MVSLEVAALPEGGGFVAKVSNSTNVSALYVKPMLLDAEGKQLAYVAFDSAFVTIRPGEPAQFGLVEKGSEKPAVMFCAEAWNAPRACTSTR